MPEPTTHFTFSDSFTGSLKQALKQAGRADAVFCFLDDLSFGPINPPDPASRLEWIDRELFVDFGDRAAEIKRLNAFWTTAQTAERRLVWVSKRVARERADFLEWVWRMGNAPYQVVEFDEADVTFQRPDGQTRQATVNSLALLRSEHLVAARYWDRVKAFEASDRERCNAIWARLRKENAPLRILERGELVSAPISVFDEQLVSFVTADWRKIARPLAEALIHISYDGPFHQIGEWVLHARLIALAKAGRVETRGDMFSIQTGEVRLPTSG